jgi:HK97 family phage portal protein
MKRTIGTIAVWTMRQAARALKYAGIPLRDPALIDLFGVKQTQSGVHIDEYSAMNFSAYYSGVNLIASVIAMMGVELVKFSDKGVQPQPLHVATVLFRDGPNPHMTPYGFIEMLQTHAVTWGNGYAFIERAGYNGEDLETNTGPPVALWPLMPDQMFAEWDKEGRKIFRYTAKYPGEQSCVFEDSDILQIPGFGYDGLMGSSVVQLARESIALGLACEKFGASFFGNNAVPGGIITHPQELDDIAKANIVSEVEDKAKGPFRARKTVVLDEGMKYQQIGVPPEDSQFLQTRQFQVREISRWLRIPPHMLFDLEQATFSNIEHQNMDFLTYTLGPWLERWIQEMRCKLLTEREQQDNIAFRFKTAMLLRSDKAKRFEIYTSGRNLGVFSLNDIAQMEELPLLPEPYGNSHVAPSTMRTLEADDPSTPVAPEVLQSTIDIVKGLKPSLQVATEIFNATIPSATETFIKSLCAQLQKSGDIQAGEVAT